MGEGNGLEFGIGEVEAVRVRVVSNEVYLGMGPSV